MAFEEASCARRARLCGPAPATATDDPDPALGTKADPDAEPDATTTDDSDPAPAPITDLRFDPDVSKALITAKFVTTSFDRTMQITKQFYQTNQGREWRVKLAGLKTDGSTETAALEAIHADTSKKRKRS